MNFKKSIFLLVISLIFSVSMEVYGNIEFLIGVNNTHLSYEMYSEQFNKHGFSYQFGLLYRHKLKNFPNFTLKAGFIYSDWLMKYSYQDEDVEVGSEYLSGFDRYEVTIDIDEHWRTFQFPLILERDISKYTYLMGGFLFIIENRANYNATADIVLYDDYNDTTYQYNNITNIDAELQGKFDSDELEKDLYLLLGIGFKFPQEYYVLHPEIYISYNLTPDRKDWEIDNASQFYILFGLSFEIDPYMNFKDKSGI